MALDRKYQKIFGKNAEVTDLGVVGSKNAGNPDTSNDVEELQSLSNWETGLRAQVTASEAPYLQDQNAIFYVITSQLAYLFQSGIAEWNAQTEYFSGRSVVLKDGKTYIAIANSVGIEPEVTSGWGGYWKNMFDWGRIVGDIKRQRDLMDKIGTGYFAICNTARTTGTKEITLTDFVSTEGGTPPNGTRLTVCFANGSNTNLNDTEFLITYTDSATSSHTTTRQHQISIKGDSTLERKFYVANSEIVTFVYMAGQGFVCEDTVAVFTRANDTTIADGRWYKIYRSGRYEEQGVYTYGGGHSSSYAVTLSQELAYNTYYIGLTARGGALNGVYADNISTTGFTIKSSSQYLSTNYSWKVEGLIKLNA